MTVRNGLPPDIEDKLDEALALLAAGLPLETVLNQAGDDAAALRPLLQIAQDTGNLQSAIPIPLPNASMQKMLAHGQVLAAAPPAQPGLLTRLGVALRNWGHPMMLFSFRATVLATFVIFAFLFGTVFGGGLTFAAQDSLPGEQIYPLKRLGESIRLGLTWSAINREKLQDTYNQRRLYETELLLKQGRKAQIGLTGSIEAINGNVLSLNGLIIQISPDTIIKGDLFVGARVQIEAITRPPNVLIAITLTVIEAGPPTPVFTPTPTVTITPSPAPTNTPTATPTVEKVQTGDTLSLPPTATPTVKLENNDNPNDNDDNDNSGSSEEENENDDDNSGKGNSDDPDDDDNDNENDDDDNSNEDDADESDDTDNSGSSDDDSNENDDDPSDDPDDDNSGSSSDDEEDNSGSGSDSDNSGSGSSNSGSSSDDDNSGKGSSDDDKDDDKKDDDDD